VEEKAAEEAPAVEKVAEEKAEPAKPAPAPRSQEDLQARRARIQEIYKLGRSGDAEDLKKLEAIITGDGKAFEKATAIRALGNDKKDGLVEPLKKLAEGTDLAVKSESAILLYQWGEKEFAKPLMESMLDQGVALRRAFFKGIEDGKYVYDDEALAFFEKAMEAKQVHVRLDAALGLLHLDKKEVALAAFAEALADKEKEYVRLTAVSYLASARDIPEAKALLEAAANDSSARVANRAKQILGTSLPKPAAK
jgi:HEAT repeat protein